MVATVFTVIGMILCIFVVLYLIRSTITIYIDIITDDEETQYDLERRRHDND